jgi:hypothetical protein
VLVVKLPGPGTVELLGTHEDVMAGIARVLQPGHHRFDWGRASATVEAADTITVTLHPSRHGHRLLARHRRYGMALNVTIWVSYTPTGGNTRSKKTNVRVLSSESAGQSLPGIAAPPGSEASSSLLAVVGDMDLLSRIRACTVARTLPPA